MVSFKWLKDQKMLRQGSTPRCVKQDEVFPDFTETTTLGESMQYFSTDGVFISGSLFFRPGAYCVDGELDTEGGGEEQPSHVRVIVCGRGGRGWGGVERRHIPVMTGNEHSNMSFLVRACVCAIGVFQTRWYHYNH